MIWSYTQHFANVKAQKQQRKAKRELEKLRTDPHYANFFRDEDDVNEQRAEFQKAMKLRDTRKAVLWECKDFADGWIPFTNETAALYYQYGTGCVMRVYYKEK